MGPYEETDCTGTLLDVIYYELSSRRLSPEMRALLASHLADCPKCSRQVLSFKQLIEEQDMLEMLGRRFPPFRILDR